MSLRTSTAAVLLLVFAVAPAAAQRRSEAVAAANAAKEAFAERNGAGSGVRKQDPLSPRSAAKKTMEGVVVAVAGDGTVAIRGEDGLEASIRLLTAPIVAQDRRQFGGRRSLEASDLEPGHRLRITYRPDTLEIVKVKVLRERDR